MRQTEIMIFVDMPPPINGMTIVNKHSVDIFKSRFFDSFKVVDTKIVFSLKSKSEQGKYSFKLVVFSIVKMLKAIFKVLFFRPKRCYYSPPQSFIGILRFIPVIYFSVLVKSDVYVHIHGSKFEKNITSAKNIFLKRLILKVLKSVNIIFLSEKIRDMNTKNLCYKTTHICMNSVNSPKCDIRLLKKKKNSILYFSNLMSDKGIFEFIDAVSLINKKYSDFSVCIAGEIEPSNKTRIENLLKENDFINYVGAISCEKIKSQLFSDSELFCLPSYDEGIPLSIIEAYSYGCSVVTTNVGGISDIFQDGINGYYAKVGDVNSLVNAIELSLKTDFVRNNINYYLNHFTNDIYEKKLNGIIK